MKVLVTGGTGFTGSHTVEELVAAGHQVRLLVRDAAKVRRVFAPHGLEPSDLVVGDMTDAAAVEKALAGCDGVLHSAALVDLRRASARRVEDTNARGVELVVGGAVERGLATSSTCRACRSSSSPAARPSRRSCRSRAPPPLTRARRRRPRSTCARLGQGRVRRDLISGRHRRPRRPRISDANHAVYSWYKDTGVITSSGFQCVDVRDVAALHVKLLALPPGPHRYGAAAEMVPWAELYERLDRIPARVCAACASRAG